MLKYREGFYELPSICDSPQLMWESFKSMPFINFDAVKNNIRANNPFVEADVYYHEPKDGVVVIVSSVLAKKNIVYRQLFEKQSSVKHYCLTCFMSEPEQGSAKSLIHDVHFEGAIWFLLKPGAKIKNYHYKGSYSTSVNIYFTQKWLETNIIRSLDTDNPLIRFLESSNEVIASNPAANNEHQEMLERGKALMTELIGQERNKPLNEYISEFVHRFKIDCLNNIENRNYFGLTNIDRIKIQEAEKVLEGYIYSKFPGIAYLAHEVSVSETKLKTLFKLVHNTSILNYFHQIKMAAAKKMLDCKEQKIADIASHFGYENPSKFSAAFKQQYGYLPSQNATNSHSKPQLK